MGSETTAAAAGAVGEVRRDPFAMLPFCGYHMGDYFDHWLRMGNAVSHPPRIFTVNWFRKDEQGKFLWPGFGQNMRVLKWIFERCEGRAQATETPLGYAPRYGDLDWTGLGYRSDAFERSMQVDREQWFQELASHDQLLQRLGSKRPERLSGERARLAERLGQR
jgi:phosphoenolpyruvate carboxykinase (GTP)